MQFSEFTKTTLGSIITFSNDTPIEYVSKIKYYLDDASGIFSKKEFRWSFNKNYWSSWEPLNQRNISKLNINNHECLFLEIRYITLGSGKVNIFFIDYDQIKNSTIIYNSLGDSSCNYSDLYSSQNISYSAYNKNYEESCNF